MLASHLLDEWPETDRPSIDRRLVDRYAALLHHFLDVMVAQQVGRISADPDHDDFDRKTHTLKIEHAVPPKFRWCSLP